MSYLKKILNARVYDVAQVTPIHVAKRLSARLANTVLLKREDLQPVFSFKLRGAYNKMFRLSAETRERGVIAASAGNHAQGVALAADKLKIPAYIVMPETTPAIKTRAVRDRGAEIILHGDSFDEACAHAVLLARQKELCFIHPYDDPDVSAGQGTIGLDILQQHPLPDVVFVPVGGGGLLAGIATCLKELRPEIRVIGVESEESACLTAALQAGRRVTLPQVGLFVDGVAVARVGAETFRLARRYADGVITVSNDQVCAATRDLFEDTRSIAEPAGALALAGLKHYVDTHQLCDSRLMAIVSGANVDFHGLRHISERAELGEKREAILAATIPERPGSFYEFCLALDRRTITEFNYRYAHPQLARIYVGVRLGADDRSEHLSGQLNRRGYPSLDLSDNEMAKQHLRFMVGGHSPQLQYELLFRFQFAQRPGALARFLERLAGRWNISLFHYRNHSAAAGYVLAGLVVPPTERGDCHKFLNDLNYPYTEETQNPAYQLFLGQATGRELSSLAACQGNRN